MVLTCFSCSSFCSSSSAWTSNISFCLSSRRAAGNICAAAEPVSPSSCCAGAAERSTGSAVAAIGADCQLSSAVQESLWPALRLLWPLGPSLGQAVHTAVRLC